MPTNAIRTGFFMGLFWRLDVMVLKCGRSGMPQEAHVFVSWKIEPVHAVAETIDSMANDHYFVGSNAVAPINCVRVSKWPSINRKLLGPSGPFEGVNPDCLTLSQSRHLRDAFLASLQDTLFSRSFCSMSFKMNCTAK